MLEIGIDITRISRFKDAKQSLIDRVLHPEEKEEFSICENKELFLAARWAIKEALYKTNNELFHFDKIKVIKKNNVYTYPGYDISTSKEDDYYTAIVKRR